MASFSDRADCRTNRIAGQFRITEWMRARSKDAFLAIGRIYIGRLRRRATEMVEIEANTR